MADASNDLLKLIHDTKALSIWNRKTGPIFWYILGVPGPFYFNIELMLGKTLSEDLLQNITSILAATADLAIRAEQLNKVILTAYENNAVYAQIIAAMAAKTRKEFPAGSYRFISGGERRDWLFSIPLAKELGIPHVFLFKNQSHFYEQSLKPHEAGLHVADLINNAASYFEMWLPTLNKAQLKCPGTVCVVSRGNGAKKLEESGVKVAALVEIDLGFFERSLTNGLINRETLTEIACHFASPKDWAIQYLMGDVKLFDVKNLDKKSFERLQSFFTNDPWSLKSGNEVFFAAMRVEIAKRLNT